MKNVWKFFIVFCNSHVDLCLFFLFVFKNNEIDVLIAELTSIMTNLIRRKNLNKSLLIS
jgi:hypothetical protein